MIKNILVTGGAGYIGSHITEILINRKKNVVIVDDLSSGFKRLINKKAVFIKLNIRETKKLIKLINKYRIDTIIHLAGSLIIGEGEKFPKKYFRNNVIHTKSVLLASKNSSVKNFLFSSTAAVYKDGLLKVNETSKLKPKSIYGKTKLQAEKLIKKFCIKFKINYGILRYFNVVGASPSGKIGLMNKSDHLFKNFSLAVYKKTPMLQIYGTNYSTKDGTCIRDFIHVSDIAEIHYKVILALHKTHKSKILNCGYGKGISVLEVAKEFKKQSKKEVNFINKPRRKGDLSKIIASNNNLLKFIKWTPKHNKIEKMVKSCLTWEKKIRNLRTV